MNEWEDQAWEDLPARIDQMQAELFQSEQVKDNSRPFTHVSLTAPYLLRVVHSTCTICHPSTSCVKSWPYHAFTKSSKKKKRKKGRLFKDLANSLFSQWLLFPSLKSGNPVKEGFGYMQLVTWTCHLTYCNNVLYLVFLCNLLHLQMFCKIVMIRTQNKLRAQLQNKLKIQMIKHL